MLFYEIFLIYTALQLDIKQIYMFCISKAKKIIGEFFNKKKIIRNYKIFFFNYFFAEY